MTPSMGVEAGREEGLALWQRPGPEGMTTGLYQLEVKLALARAAFPVAEGWRLTIHVDPMEEGKGGKHQPGKVERVNAALREL